MHTRSPHPSKGLTQLSIRRNDVKKITPFLWFDTQAEEAMNFYVSVFENSRVINVSYYGEEGPKPAGTVMTATFELNGQEFVALNGGPEFKFTEAISFYVHCETQKEVDELWEKLTADGGKEDTCGWLKDKYGLSWQIVPNVLGRLLQDPDLQKTQRVMKAVLKMKKIDIAALKRAYEGE